LILGPTVCRLPLIGALSFAAASAGIAADTPRLTPAGVGDLKIGMRERDAVRRFHLKVARDDGVSSFECRENAWPAHPDVWVMAERGKVTRITIEGASRLRTDRGLGIGSTEAEVRRSYGAKLKIETRPYEAEPAHQLTFWTAGGSRGVRYDTNAEGVVEAIFVGGRSIVYIEGCL
jgi:hypothetical protein